jgi:hypothetical protein
MQKVSVILIVWLIFSCKQETTDKYKIKTDNSGFRYTDSLSDVLLKCGLKQLLSEKDLNKVKDRLLLLIRRDKFTLAFLADSIFLQDHGDFIQEQIPYDDNFDFSDKYIAYISTRAPGLYPKLYIYDRKLKRTKYTILKSLYYPCDIIISGNYIVVSDAYQDHIYDISTNRNYFLYEGSLSACLVGSECKAMPHVLTTPNFGSIFPYKKNLILKDRHLITKEISSKGKIVQEKQLSLIDLEQKRVIPLIANPLRINKDSDNSFEIYYYHDSLGLIFENTYRDRGRKMYRYDIEKKEVNWEKTLSTSLSINTLTSVGYPYMALGDIDSITKNYRFHIYNVYNGKKYKSFSFPFLNSLNTDPSISLYKNVLIITFNYRSALERIYYTILVNIETEKIYRIKAVPNNKRDFFDKKGNYYFYIEGAGVYY